jgi:hypothetical protein
VRLPARVDPTECLEDAALQLRLVEVVRIEGRALELGVSAHRDSGHVGGGHRELFGVGPGGFEG